MMETHLEKSRRWCGPVISIQMCHSKWGWEESSRMERVVGGGVSSRREVPPTGRGRVQREVRGKKKTTTAIYFHYLWQMDWTPQCINAVIVPSRGDCFLFRHKWQKKNNKKKRVATYAYVHVHAGNLIASSTTLLAMFNHHYAPSSMFKLLLREKKRNTFSSLNSEWLTNVCQQFNLFLLLLSNRINNKVSYYSLLSLWILLVFPPPALRPLH